MALSSASAAAVTFTAASSHLHLLLTTIRGGGGAKVTPSPTPPPSTTTTTTASSSSSPWLATFYNIPQPIRFFISGNVGNVVLFFCERFVALPLLNNLVPENALPASLEQRKDALSFFLAYMIHIVPQHLLHAILVYGPETINTRQKYLKTLAGMYSAMTTACIGSTFLNAFLLERVGMDKAVAFVTTLLTFACINYFVIGWILRTQTAAADTKKAAVVPPRGGGGSTTALWWSSLAKEDKTSLSLQEWVQSQGDPVNNSFLNDAHIYLQSRNSN